MWRCVLWLVFLIAAANPVAAQATQQPEPQDTGNSPQTEIPRIEEHIVVTASRAEEQLLNAPASVTVIGAAAIEHAAAQGYVDLLRTVPGVNAIQTSGRDFNLTSRGATKTTANTQLVLVDGRSVYLDFLGFVLWDGLPEPGEIKQIEVIRGPASAVWGANALDGVVNILTKSPRELAGTSITIGAGAFDRTTAASEPGMGGAFYARVVHAVAVNDRLAYKLSSSYDAQDALPRPSGTLANPFHTPYPAFANAGVSEPKLDLRLDYDFPDQSRKLVFGGGASGVSGILHTGSGPFQLRRGAMVGYSKVNYSKDNLKLNGFVNFVSGDATSLLSLDATGRPIAFTFKNQTYDVEFGNGSVLGGKHLVNYGGNLRYSNFDLSVAPEGKNRTEGGAYVQDHMVLNDAVHWFVGARIDKFGVVDRLAFSPRTALVLKPAPQQSVRLSVNRAFRAPTLINNFLALKLISAIDLGLINPALAGQQFVFPFDSVGNRTLREESVTTYEAGYTALLRNRTTIGVAYYVNRKQHTIILSQVASYTSQNPPPGWPLPGFVLDALNQAGAGLPSRLTDVNAGRIGEQGLEMSGEADVRAGLSVFTNYSWQKQPTATGATLNSINLPARHRVNAGVSYDRPRYFAGFALNHTGEAVWRDVLDGRFHGPTPAFTRLDADGGWRWAGGKRVLSLRVTNLANREIQQHIFGDILKRRVTAELRVGL